MLVEGKKIAAEIAGTLHGSGLTLLILQIGDERASTSFVNAKKKFGQRIGVAIMHEKLPSSTSANTSKLVSRINQANGDKNISGIIVQLPLPARFDEARVLEAISSDKNPEKFSPVVAAIEEVINRYHVDLYFSTVVVVGHGKLVGQPVTKWLKEGRVEFSLVTEESQEPQKVLRDADVIITGVGKAGLIKPDMIKEGVVLIDAGTSESGGALRGDADPTCADKASLFTPVPGGLGPITVAMLFKNLIALSAKQ